MSRKKIRHPAPESGGEDPSDGSSGNICDDHFEREAKARAEVPVAGADEVGRGALFGPVVAGAVILGEGFDWTGLNDSKKLTAKRRSELAERIRAHAAAWSIGMATAEEIDRLNIKMATHLAIRRAVTGLKVAPRLVHGSRRATRETSGSERSRPRM